MRHQAVIFWCIAVAAAAGACNGKVRVNAEGGSGGSDGAATSGGPNGGAGGSAGTPGTGGASANGGATSNDGGACFPDHHACTSSAQCCARPGAPLTCDVGFCKECLPMGARWRTPDSGQQPLPGCDCCSGNCADSGLCACMPKGGGCFKPGPNPDCCSKSCVQTGPDAYRCG